MPQDNIEPKGGDNAAQGKSRPDTQQPDNKYANEARDTRKSAVRVLVTYIAAGFLFVVGAGFIGALFAIGEVEDAKNVFLAILPVSAAVITFWFAGRNNQQHDITEIIKATKGES